MNEQAPSTGLDALDLTTSERRYLAMHARYESQRQDDPRYCAADRTARDRLRARWRAIADELHPDPWGAPLTAEEKAEHQARQPAPFGPIPMNLAPPE